MTTQNGTSLIPRSALFFVAMVWFFGLDTASAEKITISSANTSSKELTQVVAEAIDRLQKSRSGESHRLILQGEFSPLSSVKIQWWGDRELIVSGTCTLDGSCPAQRNGDGLHCWPESHPGEPSIRQQPRACVDRWREERQVRDSELRVR